ncbi:MAG TPA: helix-hairpin-helix domain-containing protein [Chitinophagaceae bacterium]|nr:helix-hairpin-helix domain-containing protein [Chitinophagaceae bacterium]
MKKKEWIKDYFTFTKKERIGILTFVLLIFILLFSPYLFPYLKKAPKLNKAEFEKEVAMLNQLKIDTIQRQRYTQQTYKEEEEDRYPDAKKYYEEKGKGELFVFDPNTATTEDWERLGVSNRTIQTIQNYIGKGGRFRHPEDLYKIYGFKKEEVARMMPYISIKNNLFDTSFNNESSVVLENKKIKSFNKQIEINAADSTAFISLPGIGSKLSQRILSYREKLGGFYSVDQLAQTSGLPYSTFQNIKPKLICNNSLIKKIDINTADINILKSHPYINYTLANVIIQYRNEHGNYKSIDDVRKIALMKDEIFEKILPYLTIQ